MPNRILALGLAMTALIAVFWVRLFDLQIIHGAEYEQLVDAGAFTDSDGFVWEAPVD